jgi:hypothetical protein
MICGAAGLVKAEFLTTVGRTRVGDTFAGRYFKFA